MRWICFDSEYSNSHLADPDFESANAAARTKRGLLAIINWIA